ncbi:MAG: efflux RND transporter periplasmic adaptor subunit [Syntrophorhabdales bacterium]|jgi:membrane fusion protein, multidrug efflux system
MQGSTRSTWVCCAAVLSIGVMLLAAGCKKGSTKQAEAPPLVEVTAVIQRDVPIYSEWTASTDGFVNATIRAQVQGYLTKQDYREGDVVKKGQVLFEIDPRTFQAALEQAKGQLSQARARWENARANLERIKPLAEEKAVSLKDLDDAVDNERESEAAVASATAMVDKARLDLEFTKVLSPITGIAGIARAQIGNLVGPRSIEELTTVSTVDPIKVYIPMSEQEFLRNVEGGSGRAERMELELILADGNVYPEKGTFAFADREVDIKTGTIKVAITFPNPGNKLRPGQFAKVRALTAMKKGALLVPQRAVAELQGRYQVAVVDQRNRVEIRPVTVAEQVDKLWVIQEGLKGGEQVVTEGLQKVGQGTLVTTQAYKP